MNSKKKFFVIFWIAISAGLFYFFRPASSEMPKKPIAKTKTLENSINPQDELPARLKGRIDTVLSKIEEMWDPTGNKVKEVGSKMEDLEKALEENKPELAEKILSEIEVIVSEK